MNELIAQLWTPELTAGFIVVIILLLILYVLSIVWVVRDAYMRGTQWYIWAIVALVPGVGLIAYLLLRPPLLQIDRDEQELEIALKQRELMRYGECATCGYPVEADYVLCPNCLTQLKNLCRHCQRALDPAWEVCPYCATPVASPGHRHTPAPRRRPTTEMGEDLTSHRHAHAASEPLVEEVMVVDEFGQDPGMAVGGIDGSGADGSIMASDAGDPMAPDAAPAKAETSSGNPRKKAAAKPRARRATTAKSSAKAKSSGATGDSTPGGDTPTA